MNTIKRKYRIKEENEFLYLLAMNLEDDFNALKEPGFYIDTIEGYNELIVLIFGEASLVNGINNFSQRLEEGYKAELI